VTTTCNPPPQSLTDEELAELVFETQEAANSGIPERTAACERILVRAGWMLPRPPPPIGHI
jgi:hypothetical protein